MEQSVSPIMHHSVCRSAFVIIILLSDLVWNSPCVTAIRRDVSLECFALWLHETQWSRHCFMDSRQKWDVLYQTTGPSGNSEESLNFFLLRQPHNPPYTSREKLKTSWPVQDILSVNGALSSVSMATKAKEFSLESLQSSIIKENVPFPTLSLATKNLQY